MRIIIEGPDATGKTTLAKQLAAPNTEYRHQGPYKVSPLWETIVSVSRAPQHIVYDRLHLGERVYGPVYRGVDRLGDVRQRMLERYLLGERVVVIMCLPSYEVSESIFLARGDEEMFASGGPLGLLKQHTAFERLRTALPMLRYDFTRGNQIAALGSFIASNVGPVNVGPGIGSFRAGNVLVVGERDAGRYETTPLAAKAPPMVFVSDVKSTTSYWLNERLCEWSVPEQKLYWINALTHDGADTPYTFLPQLKPRAIVCIGQAAERWASPLKEEFTVYDGLPDPEYWRAHHKPEHYYLLREQLEAACAR